ncbi:protein PXR1-like [Vespa mandarinia]|uniref:protein PXR1-like n=1 Tax=Vespa mandarinia TaxID=7446 RepID=UPI00160E2DFF|nr:protein PXR1-like [Vespa mandarinia]
MDGYVTWRRRRTALRAAEVNGKGKKMKKKKKKKKEEKKKKRRKKEKKEIKKREENIRGSWRKDPLSRDKRDFITKRLLATDERTGGWRRAEEGEIVSGIGPADRYNQTVEENCSVTVWIYRVRSILQVPRLRSRRLRKLCG